MTEASSAREPSLVETTWLLARQDPLTQALLVLTAVSVAATAGGDAQGVLAWLGHAAGAFAATLVLLAAGHGRSRISDRHERPFWNELVVALACWWLATLLRLLASRAGAPAEITASVLLGLAYFFLILAAERQPHRRVRWRPEGLERMLSWPAVALFVLGLFGYFVLIPLFGGRETADAGRMNPAFAVILDLYLAVQLLSLALESRKRWRVIYGLLAAMATAWLLGDLARLLHPAAGAPELWIGLGFLAAFFAVRGGQLFVATPPEESPDPRPEIGIPATIRTVVAALSFPVIHIVGYVAGWLDPADEPTRERLVFVWLLLLGAITLLQHRLLRARTEKLWRERARAKKALRKNEQNLRLMLERRSAAEAIRASQDRFAKVFRACPSSMVISRLLDGRVIEVNDSFRRMTGYPASEVLGRASDELRLWSRAEDRDDLLEALRREEVVRNRRYRFRRKDGEEHVMLIDAVELELDGDRCLLSMARDITALTARYAEDDDDPPPDDDPRGPGGEEGR